MLLKDLALGVIPNDAGVDEAAEIQPLCSKLRHFEGLIWSIGGFIGLID